MNAAILAREKLISRAATILVKRLSQNEEFKQFMERFHSDRLPVEVEEIVKSQIESLKRQAELTGGVEERALLDLITPDAGVRSEVRLQDYVNANVSEELREILSQIEATTQLDPQIPLSFFYTIFLGP